MSQNSASPPRDELNEFVNVDQPARELFILQHTIDDEGGFDGSSVEGAQHVLPGILATLEDTRLQITGLDIDPVTMDIADKPIADPNARFLDPIVEAASEAADHVHSAFLKNQKVLSLGGNHTRALDVVGALRACHEQGIPMGVVWVDAHPDLNTPESTASGHVHGMPSAVLQGRGPKELLALLEDAPTIDPTNIIYIGINAIDDPKHDDGSEKEHTELKYIQELRAKGVRVYPMNTAMKNARNNGVVPEEVLSNISELNDRIKHSGGKMWTEWDVDVVDQSDMPAAVMDNLDGMSGAQIKHLFNHMGSHCDIDGVGVSEINPAKDRDTKGRSADEIPDGEVFQGKAQKLVSEGVGHLFGVSNPNFALHMSRARKEMSGEDASNTATVSLSQRNKQRPSVRSRVLGLVGGVAASIGAFIAGTQIEQPSIENHQPTIANISTEDQQVLNQFSESTEFIVAASDLRENIAMQNERGIEQSINTLAVTYLAKFEHRISDNAVSALSQMAFAEFAKGFNGTRFEAIDQEPYLQMFKNRVRNLQGDYPRDSLSV